jgi:hypothetical protein
MPTPQRYDTPERQQASKIRASLNDQIKTLRAQRNLTREGRAARIAKAVEDAKTKLAQLRQDENERMTERAEKLHRQLFGNRNVDPQHIASIRDARDRAAHLAKDIDEVRELMTRADRDGDHILLKAYAEEVARRAGNPVEGPRGWAQLFHQWASNQTGGSDVIGELHDINIELVDPGQRMVRESAFGVGVLPEEVRGVGNIKALAHQADEIGELPPTRAEQLGAHLAKFAKGDLG